MGASTTTPNIALPQFADNDKPTWRGDINSAMTAIDGYAGSTTADIAQRTATPVTKYNVKTTNTGAQNYTNFQTMLAAGVTNILFPPGDYPLTIPSEGNYLGVFTNKSKIRIAGVGARILDTTTYTNNGALTGLFSFDNCKDIKILGLEYVGPVLSSPTTLHGYQGATLFRFVNQCDGVEIDVRASNCRYGVQTGAYDDSTKGQCKNFNIRLVGVMVGYAIAAYYASGIRHDLDVDGVHRIAYIAGCDDVKGSARYRNQYIADTSYLITDVLTSGTDTAAQANPVTAATTSRGCTNMDVAVQETGSTVMQPSSVAAGISLSRVDPCTFRNLKVNVQVAKATDTISTTVGVWRCVSGAKSIWSRYPFNWEPTIVLEDIEVQVNSDHSGQTLTGSTGSELYVFTYESSTAHAATVRGHRIRGTMKKSPGEIRPDYINLPGLISGGEISMAHDGTLQLYSSPTAPFRTSGKYNILDLAGVSGGTPLDFKSATVTKVQNGTSSVINNSTDGSSLIGGAGPQRKIVEKIIDLSSSATWAAAIPQGALLVGVQTRVQTALVGATSGYQVGVAAETNRYGDFLSVAAGTTSGTRSYKATEINPRYYGSATDLVISPNGGAFTSGTLRVILTYDIFPNPTS